MPEYPPMKDMATDSDLFKLNLSEIAGDTKSGNAQLTQSAFTK